MVEPMAGSHWAFKDRNNKPPHPGTAYSFDKKCSTPEIVLNGHTLAPVVDDLTEDYFFLPVPTGTRVSFRGASTSGLPDRPGFHLGFPPPVPGAWEICLYNTKAGRVISSGVPREINCPKSKVQYVDRVASPFFLFIKLSSIR